MRTTLSLLLLLFIATNRPSAQTVAPSVVNTCGGNVNVANIRLSWSVGEMPLISTMDKSAEGIIITNGFLQPPVTALQATNSGNFSPEEIFISPNPSTSFIDINFRTSEKGKMNITLYNNQGQIVVQRQFQSMGVAHIEQIDLQRLGVSGYFLKIVLEPDAGSIRKKGSYKIIKIR